MYNQNRNKKQLIKGNVLLIHNKIIIYFKIKK